VQQPFPEIWIPGTGSKETIEYIAQRRYSYMGIPYFRFRAFKRNFDTFRAACEQSGYEAHAGQMGMLLPIYVSDTDANARKEYEPHFDYFRKKLQEGVGRLPPGYTSATSLAMSMQHFADVIRTATDWDDLVSDFIVVGSVETVRQRLSDLAGELGFGTLLALLQMGSLPGDLTRSNQELFATEVLPYLKESFALDSEKPAMAPAPGPVDNARISVVIENPLTVETRGSGEPLVWLGSGFGESPWTRVNDALTAEHTVLSVTYPTLASGALARLRDVDDFTFNLVRLLDDAGVHEATFVASSLGGWIAADFASRYPERVKALVLVAPAGLRHPDTKAEDVFYVAVTELGPLLMENREGADLDAIPALDPTTEPLDAVVALSEGLETLARFGWNPYLNDPRLRERLVRWTGPALVLWGSEDKVLPIEHADLWAEYLGAKVQVLDGIGHLAALERPQELIEAIGSWLSTEGSPVAAVAVGE
jgi:pimeloyl-ACP methyl ester carboxylesterase